MSGWIRTLFLLATAPTLAGAIAQESPPAPVPDRALSLFDGRTLDGWEGDRTLWRVEDGAIVGGSLTTPLRQNEFLATTRRFTNFVLRAQFRLAGTGFVNSGVQIRSERVPDSSEMAGYQCDIGDPNWWGSLYDESRRNTVLAWSDMARVGPVLRRDAWNDYVIRADGNRITTWINGVLAVDYREPDPEIPGSGRLGFQVHGGGAAQAWFRAITLEELPLRPPPRGAAIPPPPPRASPLTPEEQLATFALPPGFRAELVAAEPDGGKFVGIQFDAAGRLWTMTALEYPLDANEAGPEARSLFQRGGRDRILAFDTPTRPGRQTARTFAEGLVMPLGLLPARNGAHVQYGDEIRFYADADRDGRAEGFTPILSGFGIEDSHLFPHQFLRAPGGWLWLAQGAFNFSEVRTTRGISTTFNRTKMARWRPDGSEFEILSWGPCNIWGLVLDRHGEAFIQEANDQGWPLMPLLEGASYPLCGEDVPRPYAPAFPKVGGKPMGGTGLSGLALSEGSDSFPAEWRDVFFVNNPITRKVQAIRVHRDATSAAPGAGAGGRPASYANGWHLEHLPDFLLSSDPWFRPVAMAFGPDGCLYLVDWYNQIISHNEVPRRHPERDKSRGRLWRIRHESQPHRIEVPNVGAAADSRLLEHLQAANTWEVTAAWHEIVDRQATNLAPSLAAWAQDLSRPADLRIRALWCLEGLQRTDPALLAALCRAPERSVRREALRVAAQLPAGLWEQEAALVLARSGLGDPDRLVRQESIRWLGRRLRATGILPAESGRIAGLLILAAVTPPPSGDPRFGPYFDAFETYLIRRALEEAPQALDAWAGEPPEGDGRMQAFAAITRGGVQGARRLAAIRGGARTAAPSSEEVLLLASHASDPAVRPALDSVLADRAALQVLHDHRAALTGNEALAEVLVPVLRNLVGSAPDAASEQLLIRLAAGFRLRGLEPELLAIATRRGAPAEAQATALRALRESGSTRLDVLRTLALSRDESVRREAVTAMAAVRTDEAVPALLEIWSTLTPALRRIAAERLAQSPSAARQLVDALTAGALDPRELDPRSLERLAAALPEDATLRRIQEDQGAMRQPVLRLHGGDQDYVATGWTLQGPFTVETWIQLEPEIGNQDSILGGPDQLDANFYEGRFRVWLGGGVHDIVTATRPMAPEVWTHVAVTRDAEGVFRLYLDGELDATGAGRDTRVFEKLDIGRSNVPGGTAGALAYYRLWSVCRTAEEIRNHAQVEVPPEAPGLVYAVQGDRWGTLGPTATIERTADRPPVLTSAESAALERRFLQYRTLAAQAGDPGRGAVLFATACGVCHTVRGEGGRIGPALDGAAAQGLEPLLRNILTPNAAMEAGYRRYRVETHDGDLVEGLLAAQDSDSVTLRQPGSEDQRFSRSTLRRGGFVPGSIMPEGLLEGLSDDQARDLLAYLQTLR